MSSTRRILITYALPYANGPLHAGHMLGFIATDIWARAHKLQGHEVHFVCGDDTHGTPVMLKAQAQHTSPEALIAQTEQAHRHDLQTFDVACDCYHSTHSPRNRSLMSSLFKTLQAQGLIQTRAIEQAFDPEAKMCLPDRYIQGTCPRCQTPEQYGDHCEACGATYGPLELVEPRSVLTGATPVTQHSTHYFFDLPRMQDALHPWLHHSDALHPHVVRKISEWFQTGLKPWDISRDAPYFGFPIPGSDDQFFYVWMDAPVGYMAAFQAYCDHHPALPQDTFQQFWEPGHATELVHVIGKDIVSFHAVFWPAVLMGAGYRPPSRIMTHGFVTIQGQKMSKSKGTYITAAQLAQHIAPEYVRYFFASRLGPDPQDLDLDFQALQDKINADLIGKYINIPSRAVAFLHRFGAGTLDHTMHRPDMWDTFLAAAPQVAQAYAHNDLQQVTRIVMQLADQINQYWNTAQPWHMARQPAEHPTIHAITSMVLRLFWLVTGYLAPIIPNTATQVAQLFQCTQVPWPTCADPLYGHAISTYQPLLQRITPAQWAPLTQRDDSTHPSPMPTDHASITLSDFQRIELRVAAITHAERVSGSHKLVRLTVDLGDDRDRTVFAGLQASHDAAQLVGRLTVMVANLAPRTMRFGVSEGMVLAASSDDPEQPGIFLLSPDAGATPGMRVR